MVKITSANSGASFASLSRVAPRLTKLSVLLFVLLKTKSSCPASIKCPAILFPITPVPIHAIFIFYSSYIKLLYSLIISYNFKISFFMLLEVYFI